MGETPDFDIVIATRNRPEALALSVPLLLGQSHTPGALIVIDASDDHGAVRRTVEAAVARAGWGGRLVVARGAPGLTRQRNAGLAHVTAPVTLFPDDDSLYHPGAVAAILAVYARDTAGAVAGVCGRETPLPPIPLEGAAYGMSASHRRDARLGGLRKAAERLRPDLNPLAHLGGLMRARHTVPEWLAGLDAVPVETMTGFRMSFRTAAIRAAGFDEALQDHGLGEDIDACFAVARGGLLVGAHGALIYHHRHPGGRGDARTAGVVAVLNRAYVMARGLARPGLSPPLTPDEVALCLRLTDRFLRARHLAAAAATPRTEGRARLAGLRAALPHARALMALAGRGAGPEAITARYLAALETLGLRPAAAA